ncbi:unnamed protein product [Boreogadus saida]
MRGVPAGVQPGQSGIPGFAQEGEIPIDSPARDDPSAGNDDETRDAVIWYDVEHEPQEPQPAPTGPLVVEGIYMEDTAEMPEETTVAVRRSARPTAGQHSNPHRLPKTMSVMDDSPSGIEGVGQVGGCDQAGVKAPGVLMPLVDFEICAGRLIVTTG